MPERAKSVVAILDELHAALEDAPEIGEESRSALRETISEIREAVETPDAERSRSLADQLSTAVERFEVAHPQLTGIVGRIADALSDLGV